MDIWMERTARPASPSRWAPDRGKGLRGNAIAARRASPCSSMACLPSVRGVGAVREDSDFTRQQCLWEHPRTQTTRHTLQAQELNRVRPRPTSARRNGRVDLYGSSSHTNDLSMSALSRPTSA